MENSFLSPSGNRYYLVRHGESLSNTKNISSYSWEKEDPLTNEGIIQAKKLGEKLRDYKIDFIFCSPFRRTKETFNIMNKELKADLNNIFFDERLIEINFGSLDNKPYETFHKLFLSGEDYFKANVPNGENYSDVLQRISEFFSEVESNYSGKNILIISHGLPLGMFEIVSKGLTMDQSLSYLNSKSLSDREKICSLEF